MEFRQYRHVNAAFVSEQFTKKGIEVARDEVYDQAGHTSHNTARAYATTADEHQQLCRDKLLNHHKVSHLWQELIGCKKADTCHPQTIRPLILPQSPAVATTVSQDSLKEVAASQAEEVATRDAHEQPDTVRLLNELRTFYKNPSARFKSAIQCRAFDFMLKCVDSLLIVLPTGAGKSLVFMLPAYIERETNRLTVVIVPLR